MHEDTDTRSFVADDLPVTAAESWVKEKVQIINQYLTAFVTNQIGKADDIIFVDLFAGNGLYSLGPKKGLFASSALMSLSLDLPITKFVLCESDPDSTRILKIRVNRYFRGKNILLLEGRPDELIERIGLYVPPSKGNYKSAVLCLCDPFSLELSFDTIARLADLGFSFLMPFTFALNEQINFEFYLDEQTDRVRNFLGGDHSYERLSQQLESNAQFYKRLVRIYENNLLSLGLNGATSVHKMDSGLMDVPVYYIGFFSKRVSTKFIQQDVEAARNIQFELFK